MTDDKIRPLAYLHMENEPEYMKRLISRLRNDNGNRTSLGEVAEELGVDLGNIGDNVDEVAENEARYLELQAQAYASDVWLTLP